MERSSSLGGTCSPGKGALNPLGSCTFSLGSPFQLWTPPPQEITLPSSSSLPYYSLPHPLCTSSPGQYPGASRQTAPASFSFGQGHVRFLVAALEHRSEEISGGCGGRSQKCAEGVQSLQSALSSCHVSGSGPPALHPAPPEGSSLGLEEERAQWAALGTGESRPGTGRSIPLCVTVSLSHFMSCTSELDDCFSLNSEAFTMPSPHDRVEQVHREGQRWAEEEISEDCKLTQCNTPRDLPSSSCHVDSASGLHHATWRICNAHWDIAPPRDSKEVDRTATCQRKTGSPAAHPTNEADTCKGEAAAGISAEGQATCHSLIGTTSSAPLTLEPSPTFSSLTDTAPGSSGDESANASARSDDSSSMAGGYSPSVPPFEGEPDAPHFTRTTTSEEPSLWGSQELGPLEPHFDSCVGGLSLLPRSLLREERRMKRRGRGGKGGKSTHRSDKRTMPHQGETGKEVLEWIDLRSIQQTVGVSDRKSMDKEAEAGNRGDAGEAKEGRALHQERHERLAESRGTWFEWTQNRRHEQLSEGVGSGLLPRMGSATLLPLRSSSSRAISQRSADRLRSLESSLKAHARGLKGSILSAPLHFHSDTVLQPSSETSKSAEEPESVDMGSCKREGGEGICRPELGDAPAGGKENVLGPMETEHEDMAVSHSLGNSNIRDSLRGVKPTFLQIFSRTSGWGSGLGSGWGSSGSTRSGLAISPNCSSPSSPFSPQSFPSPPNTFYEEGLGNNLHSRGAGGGEPVGRPEGSTLGDARGCLGADPHKLIGDARGCPGVDPHKLMPLELDGEGGYQVVAGGREVVEGCCSVSRSWTGEISLEVVWEEDQEDLIGVEQKSMDRSQFV